MLLHGMRMWPAMITTMFWPFALKAMAERLNRLHVHPDGSTPESKLYGICGESIPVGSYHTLLCPVYILDARAQNEGAMGPPKHCKRESSWENLGKSSFSPRSSQDFSTPY